MGKGLIISSRSYCIEIIVITSLNRHIFLKYLGKFFTYDLGKIDDLTQALKTKTIKLIDLWQPFLIPVVILYLKIGMIQTYIKQKRKLKYVNKK